MFIQWGTPKHKLADLRLEENINSLKKSLPIAVIDDNPFPFSASLRAHNFRIDELGGDIRSVEQVSSYPIVVCDIMGVGSAFESEFEGAHVVSEIRKAFPDKYLIAFTGVLHNIKYNKLLATADNSIPKDTPTDNWAEALEKALLEVGTPRNRWIRFRTHLAKSGFDSFEIFNLEQAFIEAVKNSDPSVMKSDRVLSRLPPALKSLTIRFAETALVAAVTAAIG